MPIYHKLGKIPRKRHAIFRDEEGRLLAEELKGNCVAVSTFGGTSHGLAAPATAESPNWAMLRSTKLPPIGVARLVSMAGRAMMPMVTSAAPMTPTMAARMVAAIMVA